MGKSGALAAPHAAGAGTDKGEPRYPLTADTWSLALANPRPNHR